MFVTIQQRLQQLEDVRRRVEDGSIVFDADKMNFGFRRMDQLLDVSEDAIKGYPCVAYNRLSDPVKFGVKLIPLETKYPLVSHPCHLEARVLQEITELVRNSETPHIAYYFKSFPVRNKKKAVVRFPLKALRHEIYKESEVLVAEYVPGGCIDEWVDEQPNITEKQWKYVIFSVAWTLFVMQDKLRLHHNDFHCGNVLIDTAIDPADKSYYQYVLNKVGGESLVFNIQNCGVLGKIWDPEFSASYDKDRTFKNDFYEDDEEDIPHTFNPYYDLHCFLMSLLRLPIPERLMAYICSIYPKEVIPPEPSLGDNDTKYTRSSRSRSEESSERSQSSDYDSNCSTSSSETYSAGGLDHDCFSSSVSNLRSQNEMVDSQEGYDSYETSNSEKVWESGKLQSDFTNRPMLQSVSQEDLYYTRHYKTDESSSSSEALEGQSELESASDEVSASSYYNSTYSGNSSRTSRIRTAYTLGDRLLNGAEKAFNLPTPYDIITSDYFAEYRKPIPQGLRKDGSQRAPVCVFTYAEREHHDDYQLPCKQEDILHQDKIIKQQDVSNACTHSTTTNSAPNFQDDARKAGKENRVKRPPTPIPRLIKKRA